MVTVPDSFGFQIDIHHAYAGDGQPTNSLYYFLQSRAQHDSESPNRNNQMKLSLRAEQGGLHRNPQGLVVTPLAARTTRAGGRSPLFPARLLFARTRDHETEAAADHTAYRLAGDRMHTQRFIQHALLHLKPDGRPP